MTFEVVSPGRFVDGQGTTGAEPRRIILVLSRRRSHPLLGLLGGRHGADSTGTRRRRPGRRAVDGVGWGVPLWDAPPPPPGAAPHIPGGAMRSELVSRPRRA